jgi:hypothetical protein
LILKKGKNLYLHYLLGEYKGLVKGKTQRGREVRDEEGRRVHIYRVSVKEEKV